MQREFLLPVYAVITVYHTWMEQHGGSIVNIIIDMWRGFPGMAYVYHCTVEFIVHV